jgi:hypothetical protein
MFKTELEHTLLYISIFTKSSKIWFNKKKPAEAGSGYFCYEVYPTLGAVRQPMRTVRRLRLRFLLLRPGYPNPNGFCFAELSTSILLALSKPMQAHQKRNRAPRTITATIPIANLAKSSSITYSPFGGPGRGRTAVQNTFLSASYSNNLTYAF